MGKKQIGFKLVLRIRYLLSILHILDDVLGMQYIWSIDPEVILKSKYYNLNFTEEETGSHDKQMAGWT